LDSGFAVPLTTRDFDFNLPSDLIAQQPLDRRDQSRLMHLTRASGELTDWRFADLPDLLAPGDLLVLNDTRVIPAKFFMRRPSGGRLEGLFLQDLGEGRWEVMLKNAGRCKPDEPLSIEGAKEASLVLVENRGKGKWHVRPEPACDPVTLLDRVGQTPLPPYIRRADAGQESTDRPRYQTVYADRPGAVAAPTAGLHFTPELFAALAARNITTARVTLHVGLGTFLPVKTDDLTDHQMHSEWYDLSAQAAEVISMARQTGRRIVAVGTTAVRVLETVARDQAPTDRHAPLAPASGWTDIFLYPPADFHVVDALITNFHLPQSTLVMLVAAFCNPAGLAGREMILAAYRHAVAQAYRFFSYGDAMLID
jgi:S-adenosylmethionine:tRNA ribosyltransferase-isomerase